ncbi:MAG: PilZ domain-containing protein [Novosphingobium sp.]|nr:PilZ domain-containing protein [Novosphingobium sp.]
MRHEVFSNDSRPLRSFAQRARLSILCEVRQGTRPWQLARLSDLSETGFKLAWLPDYDPSKPLRIRIPGIEMLSAKICWHEGKQIGCEFASPLHVAVFEHIVRLAGGATD